MLDLLEQRIDQQEFIYRTMGILEMYTFEDAIYQKNVSVNPQSSEKPRYSARRIYNVTLGQG
jgi:hypothetical protein